MILFSITTDSFIATKSRAFIYKTCLCLSKVLFIFNNRNNKIPFVPSIKVAFMHT